MYYHSAFRLLVAIVMLLSCIHSYLAAKHYKRSNANGNVFNLLLGLYKLNPLKGSDIYRSFSDKLLLSRGEKPHKSLKRESHENDNAHLKHALNEIENMIHATSKKPPRTFVKPEYEVDDVSTENFKVDIVVNDKILSKENFRRAPHADEDNNFSSILGHIASNEIDAIPVTRLLPVNETIIRNSQMSNAFDPYFEIIDNKITSDNHVDALVEFRDSAQDRATLDMKLDEIPDVVVL